MQQGLFGLPTKECDQASLVQIYRAFQHDSRCLYELFFIFAFFLIFKLDNSATFAEHVHILSRPFFDGNMYSVFI